MVVSPELRTDVDLEQATAEELDEYLHGLEAGDATYVHDGMALRALNRRKLYRTLGYTDFKAWCLERWAKGRSDAYARIRGADLVDYFRAGGVLEVPRNVAQVRALTERAGKDLTADQRLEVWQHALELYELDTITADKLARLVAELQPTGTAGDRAAELERPAPPGEVALILERLQAACTALRALEEVLPPVTLAGHPSVVRGEVETYRQWWTETLGAIDAARMNLGAPTNHLTCDLANQMLWFSPHAAASGYPYPYIRADLIISVHNPAVAQVESATTDSTEPRVRARLELRNVMTMGGRCGLCGGWGMEATDNIRHAPFPYGTPRVWLAVGPYQGVSEFCIECALRVVDEPGLVLEALHALVGDENHQGRGDLTPTRWEQVAEWLDDMTVADVVPLPRATVMALPTEAPPRLQRRRRR